MQARLEFFLLLLPYFCVAVSSSEASIDSSLEAGPSTRSLHGSFLSLSSGNGSLKRSRNPTNEEQQAIHQMFDTSALAPPDRNVRLDQERRGSNRSKPIIIDDGDTETTITEPINHLVNREEECTTSAPSTTLTLFTGTPQINPVGLTADIPHKPGPPQVHRYHSKEFLENFALPRHDVAALLDDHPGYPRIAEFGRGVIGTTAGSRTGTHLISQGDPSKSRGKSAISECYPFQILDWIPPLFEPKAAIATQHMSNEFLLALPEGPSQAMIMEMNTSHKIIIPFVYKLMMKPLEIHHWSRILLVWRNMWSNLDGLDKTKVGLGLSKHKVLARFLWISDLISESTIPQLIEEPKWNIPPSQRYVASPGTRIINFLSGVENKDKLYGSRMQTLLLLSQILNKELDAIDMRYLAEDKYSDTISLLILEQLNSKGVSIQQTVDIQSWTESYPKIRSSSYDSKWVDFKDFPITLENRMRSIFYHLSFNQKQFASELASKPTFTKTFSFLECNQYLRYRCTNPFNPERDGIYPQRIHNLFA